MKAIDTCFDCDEGILPTDQYMTVHSWYDECIYRFHLGCAFGCLGSYIGYRYDKSEETVKMTEEAEFTKRFWEPWNISSSV